MRTSTKQLSVGIVLAALALGNISCAALAKNEVFYGKTVAPSKNVLHYFTGDEPESLDPQIGTLQPDARIYMALFEGLVEYGPRNMQPVPAVAERWKVNADNSEFVFYLRKTARWSNGDAINAHDFVYSFRRGLLPQLAARNASFGYHIMYAEAYNQGAVFVQDAPNHFLRESDFAPESKAPQPRSQKPLQPGETEYKLTGTEPRPDRDTPFHQLMHSSPRLTLPGAEKARNKLLSTNPKLNAAVAGKKFIAVKAEDIGVEAIDDYTLRISLRQSVPFFLDLLANPFFRLVPQNVIKKLGDRWTEASNIVTCGPFKMRSWKPYNELTVTKDPMYWDTASVQLDEIDFYPMADLPSVMNVYKVGGFDAVGNHTVPSAWLDVVRPKKDYMEAPEAAAIYIVMNTTKPPMNDLRVRRAFNLAIDKQNWVTWKKIVKPLGGIVPADIFTGYPYPKGEGFDPDKARALLAQAGYPVNKKSDGSYECPAFPIEQVEYTFPTATPNKIMGEFMQAQWKQNLGITVPLRSMEAKTFFKFRPNLEYKGLAFGGFVADYMDPYTFLGVFYVPTGDNSTGWWDQKYVDMLDEANTLEAHKRLELLAKAEKFMMDAQPIIPIETGAVNWVKKPYVKGMYPNAGSLFPWKLVYIERDPSKWDYSTPSLAE
ncbi:MAG TPA: peptide ABC transporter substrate-binding protein [Pyrinomonadaceae bacterium]|nr:peptide ABC transporter substrate-binding protein [Pyrinomonadaceae bacterium]